MVLFFSTAQTKSDSDLQIQEDHRLMNSGHGQNIHPYESRTFEPSA